MVCPSSRQVNVYVHVHRCQNWRALLKSVSGGEIVENVASLHKSVWRPGVSPSLLIRHLSLIIASHPLLYYTTRYTSSSFRTREEWIRLLLNPTKWCPELCQRNLHSSELIRDENNLSNVLLHLGEFDPSSHQVITSPAWGVRWIEWDWSVGQKSDMYDVCKL